MSIDLDNSLTYELRLTPKSSLDKEEVLNYLYLNGVDTFIEGSVENLFLDDNTDAFYNYESLEKNSSSISIYKYSQEELLRLQKDILSYFNDRVSSELISSKTEDWKSGWHDSFKPVVTKKFRVYPPWLEEDPSYINIRIDPGMAFGTGQHESTRLSLSAIEYVSELNQDITNCLDVGTGSGILSIGIKKLLSSNKNLKVVATDIDPDAIRASKQNALANGVSLELIEGSVPSCDDSGSFDLVVANILAPVLKEIIGDVSKVTHSGSFYIIAGILEENISEISELYSSFNFSCIKTFQDNGWACCIFQKN